MAKYRGTEFVRPHYRGGKYVTGHNRKISSNRPIGAFGPNVSWMTIFIMLMLVPPFTPIGLLLVFISLILRSINSSGDEIKAKRYNEKRLRELSQNGYFEKLKINSNKNENNKYKGHSGFIKLENKKIPVSSLINNKSEPITSSLRFVPKYIGNNNSATFHLPKCKWSKQISEENIIEFQNRTEALEHEMKPCRFCKP